MSLNKPVKLFINENTDVAFNLRQEFIRIRPNREGDREAIVAGKCDSYALLRPSVRAKTNQIGMVIYVTNIMMNSFEREKSYFLARTHNAQASIILKFTPAGMQKQTRICTLE